MPARPLTKSVHGALNDVGAGVIKRVGGFARLKENVRVLCRAANYRSVRSQRARPVPGDGVFGNQTAQIVVAQFLDLRNLVRGTKAVEEMQEGNARLERGGVGDGRKVVGLLN